MKRMNYKKYRRWGIALFPLTLIVAVAIMVIGEELFPGTSVTSAIGGGICGAGFTAAIRLIKRGKGEEAYREMNNEKKDERLRVIGWRTGYVSFFVLLIMMLGMITWLDITRQIATPFFVACGILLASIIAFAVLYNIFKKKMQEISARRENREL